MSAATYENAKSKAINRNYYSTRFVDDWEGSGRTMMIIDYGIPSDLTAKFGSYSTSPAIRPNGVYFYYKLHNTYENISDHGTVYEGDVAFVNTSQEKTPYNRAKTNLISTIADKDYYDSLERQYGDDIAYAKTSISFIPVNTYSWGYSQVVQAGNNIASEASIVPNDKYTYRLTYAQSDSAKADSLAFFDKLDAGTEDDASEWQGEFRSLNIDSLKELKSASNVLCDPVVYYSSNPDVTGFDPDNAAQWSTTKPDNVTAIYIDCSKDVNGQPFILSGMAVANVYITMHSPSDLSLAGKTAVNGSTCYARVYTGGVPAGSVSADRSSTAVTLRGYDAELHKTSDPESGTQAVPAGVVYGDTIEYTLSVTNNDEDFTYRDIELADVIENDLRIEKDDVRVYIGEPNTAVEIANSARVNMTKEGQNLSFSIVELLPGETINIVIPAVVTSRTGEFENTSSMSSINSVPFERTSETTYHDIKAIPVSFIKRIVGSGDPLPGATLQLMNSSNEVMDTWVSEDSAVTKELGAGKYRLRESVPPEDFESTQDIRFEISRAGILSCQTEGALDDETDTISMYDKPTAVNVTVSNTLTGNGAETARSFEYTAEMTGLIPGKEYSCDKCDGGKFTADENGNATVGFTLKTGETAVFEKLPTGATFAASQVNPGYYTSYSVLVGSEEVDSKANQTTDVETETIALNAENGYVTVSFENSKTIPNATGIARTKKHLLAVFMAFSLAMVALLDRIRKRRAVRQ